MGGRGMFCLRLRPQWEYAGIGAGIAVPGTASERPACTTRAQVGGPRPRIGLAPATAKSAKHELIARSDTIGGCASPTTAPRGHALGHLRWRLGSNCLPPALVGLAPIATQGAASLYYCAQQTLGSDQYLPDPMLA
eukprot:SAG11_NODE_1399_length_5020_cov_3.398293_1_plen_136_part_00